MYERTGYDWRSVGQLLNNDPIPGSPDELERIASGFRHQADNLGRAAGNLRLLQNRDDTCSEAVTKIMTKASDTAASLDAVRERYETISAALGGYAPELREAQRISIEAVTRATDAARRKRAAASAVEEARWRFVNVDEQVRNQAQEDYYSNKAAYEHADGDVASAQALLRQAISQRDAAGNTAQSRIKGEISSSPLNDTVLDHLEVVARVVTKAAKWVWDHIDIICIVLDVLAVVLALTGIGAPIAGLIMVVSKAAKVAHVLAKIKSAVTLFGQVVTGVRTGNWGSVAATVGMAGLSFLIGKGASKLGDKAASFTKKVIDGRNLRITNRTDYVARQIHNQAVLSTGSWTQVQQKIASNAVLPAYHAGTPTVSALLSSNNVAAASNETIRTVSGSLALLKGGDFARVSSYADELTRLAHKATTSDATRDMIANIAKEHTETAATKVKGMLEDYVEGHSNQAPVPPSTNRCQEVSVR